MKQKIINFCTALPVQLLCSLVLGGLFIYASLEKIGHTRAFADIIYNYKLLPAPFIYSAAIALPWLEMIGGICVLTWVMRRPAALLLGFFLLIFIIAISINLIRGLQFDCGCFTTIKSEGGSDPVGLLIRDFLMLIPVFILVFFPGQKNALKTTPN